MRGAMISCVGLVTLAACTSGCITSGDNDHRSQHRVISLTIPADDVQLVYLKLYAGTIRVVQAEQDVVSIEGDVRMSGAKASILRRDLDALHFDSDFLNDDVLKLHLKRPGGRRYVADLTITVPAQAALDVDLRYGTLLADLSAPQHTTIRVSAGEVDISIPRKTVAHLDARATVGDVSLHGFDELDGDAPRKRLIGARYHGELGLGDVRGSTDLDLKVTAGTIDIHATD